MFLEREEPSVFIFPFGVLFSSLGAFVILGVSVEFGQGVVGVDVPSIGWSRGDEAPLTDKNEAMSTVTQELNTVYVPLV